MRLAAPLATAMAACGCASALHAPATLPPPAPSAPGADADALLREADAAFDRRAEAGQAELAVDRYLAGAAADPTRADGVLGALRALAFWIEREPAAAERERLAVRAVELGQLCDRIAPASAACDYRLAVALGQQARERPATARDALARMVDLLGEAAAAEPGLDAGGPDRVLALVLLRAPAWPLGPGDPDAALAHARAAAERFPDHAPNWLALAEALEHGGESGSARSAWERAAALAAGADPAREPEALAWAKEAQVGLARGASR